MSTLPKYQPKFNKNIQVTADGGSLTVDSGLLTIADFMHLSHFDSLFDECVQFDDTRSNVLHPRKEVLKQVIYQQIAGYSCDDAADSLKDNRLFTSILNKSTLASQPTISRMFTSMTDVTVGLLSQLNQKYIDQYYANPEVTSVVIDLDSTHFDTFGNQEGAAFNAHYGTYGFHPLLAYDAITGTFLGAQLRTGNVYTSNRVVDFLEPILKHFLDDLHVMSIVVRADSGFAVPALYELCEKYDVKYIIRLKANARLRANSEELLQPRLKKAVCDFERHYDDFHYQAGSWNRNRRVIFVSERPAGEFLFSHTWIVTNFEEVIPETIIQAYKKRGLMENYIKEAKLGFSMDKTDRSRFVTNEARMMTSLLSYNIIQMMKILVFPKEMKNWTIGTIRTRLIKISAKIVSHAGKLTIKLDETSVYLREFFKVAHSLTTFSL